MGQVRVCPLRMVPRWEGSFLHYEMRVRKPHAPKCINSKELRVTRTDVSTCPVSEAQKWGIWGTHSRSREKKAFEHTLPVHTRLCIRRVCVCVHTQKAYVKLVSIHLQIYRFY